MSAVCWLSCAQDHSEAEASLALASARKAGNDRLRHFCIWRPSHRYAENDMMTEATMPRTLKHTPDACLLNELRRAMKNRTVALAVPPMRTGLRPKGGAVIGAVAVKLPRPGTGGRPIIFACGEGHEAR